MIIREHSEIVLQRLIVRKDHTLCSKCGLVEPVHVGDGTPAATFIYALQEMAMRHRDCTPSPGKAGGE